MTAKSQLPAHTQQMLSLILKSLIGFDKIVIRFDDPYPELPLDELRLLCHYVDFQPATAVHMQPYWPSKLILVAPPPEALYLLSQACGTRYHSKVTNVELMFDLVTKTRSDAIAVLDYMLLHFLPDQQRFRYPAKFDHGTMYVNSSVNHRKSRQRVVFYSADKSKQDHESIEVFRGEGAPDCHIEYRIDGVDEVRKQGIATVHDLALFNHWRFWDSHLSLRTFRSIDLGRIVSLSREQLSSAASYKRADKFMESHSHVLHDCIYEVPEILDILTPIDHRHFLPKPDVIEAPMIATPTVIKTAARAVSPKAQPEIELTSEQRTVIRTVLYALRDGVPLRLVVQAFAGSGKSLTLARAVGHLLRNGVRPEDILLLSFSNAGVNTMRERLGNKNLHTSTFHSFGKSLASKVTAGFTKPSSPDDKKAFASMIVLGTEALTSGKVKLKNKYVIVDESQDLDEPQLRLLQAIADQVPNVITFGDSFQSIFGFSGTMVTNLAGELGAETLYLTKSQRLTQATAATAGEIIGQEIEGTGGGLKPLIKTCVSHTCMIDSVALRVDNLLGTDKPASAIKVLTRTNTQQRPIDRALIELGIHATPSYLKTSKFNYLEQVFKLMDEMGSYAGKEPSVQDQQDVAELMRSLSGSLSRDKQKQHTQSFWAGVRTPSFPGRFAAAAYLYVHLQPLNVQKDLEHEFNRWAAVAAGFRDTASFHDFLRELTRQEPIKLATIHDVKGRERDYVLIVGIVEGNLPAYFNAKDINEELRLLYVAVTRARKRVYLFVGPCFRVEQREGAKIKVARAIYDEPSRFLTDEVMATLKETIPKKADSDSAL